MDYYTIKTTVDLTKDAAARDRLVAAIGFLSQPLVVGDPVIEKKSCVFRFAVREETLRHLEGDLLNNLVSADIGMTAKNTKIVRAERL